MKAKQTTRILALSLALLFCLCFTACGKDDTTTTAASSASTATEQITTTSGGSIVMPEGFEPATGANMMASQFSENLLAGNLSLATYRTTGYFVATDSVTVTVNAYLTDSAGENVKTAKTQAEMALWKQGENNAEYMMTVHFPADGTDQTYTFSGLESGAQYRVGFTYTTAPKYRMNGNFNFTGITAQGSDEKAVAAE
ncbi:MAG: hypothetical protein RSD61_05125 [Ruthenibacterium sp.]